MLRIIADALLPLCLLLLPVSSRLNSPQLRLDDSAYNIVIPNCPEPTQEPKPWDVFAFENNMSNPAPNHVVIPCGVHVSIPAGSHLTFEKGITIQGKLTFDDGVHMVTMFDSAFILNLGWMKIGSTEEPYQSRIIFKLISMEGGVEVANPILGDFSPVDLGQKGFVTLGGQLIIHGATSHTLMTHLLDSAYAGVHEVHVMGTPDWKSGDQIGIASSILVGKFSSYAHITEVIPSEDGSSTLLKLDRGLEHFHEVRNFTKSTNEERRLVLRPEVIKLNRNIVVMGEQRLPGFGGYMAIAHTALRQVVDGVEFFNMGQAGILDRYPLHFTFGGHHPSTFHSRLTKNSIHHSHNRCIVIQATHGVNVEYNVAYRTHGHCYVLSDGIETDNVFVGNVAMNIVPPSRPPKGEKVADVQNDNLASGFYITNVGNIVKDNIVAGAEHTGFFYDIPDTPKGLSVSFKLPGFNATDGKVRPWGLFANNLVHSTPIGFNPGFGVHPSEKLQLQGFTAWSVMNGFMGRGIGNVLLQNVAIMDFYGTAITALDVDGFMLDSALIVGELQKHVTCSVRDIAGIEASSFKPYTIRNIHFQGLSSKTNCQKENIGIHFLAPTGHEKEPLHSKIENLIFADTVDVHYRTEVMSSPLTVQVGKGGSGPIKESESIVSYGWPLFDKIVENRCEKMPPCAEGIGLIRCPGICWKSVVLVWKSKLSNKILIRERMNGARWTESPVEEIDEATGNPIWVLKLTLPTGLYNMKVILTEGGDLIETGDLPEYERVDLYDDICEGKLIF